MAKIGDRFEVLKLGSASNRKVGDVYVIVDSQTWHQSAPGWKMQRESDGWIEAWAHDSLLISGEPFAKLLPAKEEGPIVVKDAGNLASLPVNDEPKIGDVIRDAALLRDGMRICWEHQRHDSWVQGNGWVAPNADSVRKFGLVFLGWEAPGPQTGDRYVLKLGCGVALGDGSNAWFEEWRAGDVVRVTEKYKAHWVVLNERTKSLATWDVKDESWFRPIGREVAVDSDRRQPFKEHPHCAVAQRNLHAAGVACATCEILNAQSMATADKEAAEVAQPNGPNPRARRPVYEPAPNGLGGSSCGGLRWSPR